MDKLILENVRCFHGRHEIPLAPLTITRRREQYGEVDGARRRTAWRGTFDEASSLQISIEEPFEWGAYEPDCVH